MIYFVQYVRFELILHFLISCRIISLKLKTVRFAFQKQTYRSFVQCIRSFVINSVKSIFTRRRFIIFRYSNDFTRSYFSGSARGVHDLRTYRHFTESRIYNRYLLFVAFLSTVFFSLYGNREIKMKKIVAITLTSHDNSFNQLHAVRSRADSNVIFQDRHVNPIDIGERTWLLRRDVTFHLGKRVVRVGYVKFLADPKTKRRRRRTNFSSRCTQAFIRPSLPDHGSIT